MSALDPPPSALDGRWGAQRNSYDASSHLSQAQSQQYYQQHLNHDHQQVQQYPHQQQQQQSNYYQSNSAHPQRPYNTPIQTKARNYYPPITRAPKQLVPQHADAALGPPGQQDQSRRPYARPAPPQQAQTSAQRPQSRSRAFSFRSERSHRGSASRNKNDLTETHDEKEAKRLHTKADPTLAVQEAEPAAVQVNDKQSLAPLAGIPHKDIYGNPIEEPDRSNPTRSRWERPLDTIRSFEVAIDVGASRLSYYRANSDYPSSIPAPQRNSRYYPHQFASNPNSGRFPHISYYPGGQISLLSRPRSSAVDSWYGGSGPRASWLPDQTDHYGSYLMHPAPSQHGLPSTRHRPPHQMMLDGYPHNLTQGPSYYGPSDSHSYPMQRNHHSYETVTSASGISVEPAGYQTDPTSSDNSSVERMQLSMLPKNPPPVPPKDTNSDDDGIDQTQVCQPPPASSIGTNDAMYNYAPTSTHPAVAGSTAPQSTVPQRPTVHLEAPQAIPRSRGSVLRKALMSSNSPKDKLTRTETGENRKSWLMRRFSRNS